MSASTCVNLRTIVLLICICFPCFVFSQQALNPQHKKLTLADFKGPVDERSPFFARTYTIISMRYSEPFACAADKTKVQILVETGNRVSEKSWLNLNRAKNKSFIADLLSHEQGHVDIGEAFALELKTKVASTCFDPLRYKIQADSILRSMNKRYDALQMQYDMETANMMNRDMQARWKKKIAAMIASK